MFTGIISSLGQIDSIVEQSGGCEITVSSKDFFVETKLGDSVAINGICLTVTEHDKDSASFFAQI